MAQLGRISGPILKDNLLREGVDIAFETDLLYIDVNNDKIGIRNNTPGSDLHSPNIRTTNIIVDTLAQIDDITIQPAGNITPSFGDINFNPTRSVVVPGTLKTVDVKISNNYIATNGTNQNLELRTNGVGTVETNGLLVNANLHATGDITADGNITLGSDDTDNIAFNADIISNIIPDQNETFNLGQSNKRWNNIYTKLVNGEEVGVSGALIAGVNPTLDVGNSYYVTKNGDDSNAGIHTYEAFLTLKYACSQATAGDTIIVFAGEYEEAFPIEVPAGVTIKGNDFRNTIIKPTVATNNNDCFLLNGEATVIHLTIKDFYYDSVNDEGYAFRFANNATITSRSPYIQDITVITKGSVTSASDPRGFTQGDAGKGVLVDGASVLNTSQEASMLFHSCTFITPGVDALTITNGVRVEWLNSFTYFANRGLYAVNGSTGHLSTDGSTVKFGGEIRSIGSANVYGNFGAVSDGADCLMYLIQHNFGYIGAGKDVTNDTGLALQAQEVTELNSGKIYYSSTDQLGNFRIGDSFFVDFENGNTTVDLDSLTANALRGLTVTTNDESTILAGTSISTGNLRFLGNDIISFQGAINIDSQSGAINLTGNTLVDEDLDVTGNLSFGGALNVLGNEGNDTLDLNVDFDQDFNPHTTGNFDLGKSNKLWNTVFSSKADIQNITIQDNFITTVDSNTALELRASGTGNVLVSGNNVQVNNDLAVSGLTTLSNTGITGTLTHIGNYVQTGDASVTNSTVTGHIDVSESAQFEEILIDDNFITTTTSNTDLELRANGTGEVLIPNNNVTITNNLTVTNDINNTGDVDVTTTTEFNTAIVDDITIVGNEIKTNNGNRNLEFRAAGSNSNYKVRLLDDVEMGQALTVDTLLDVNNITVNGTITHTGNRTQTGNYTLSGELLTPEIRIEDNFITTTNSNADLELRTHSGNITVTGNDVVITNNLTVSTDTDIDDVTLTGLLTVNSPYNQTGTTAISGQVALNNTILLDSNIVSVTATDTDLDLRANGTGEVTMPFNDVEFRQDLTVNGTTTLNGSYVINGEMTHIGDINQQGNFYLSGELISDELKIEDNFITTVTSNSDLELRASGSGNVTIQSNDVTLAQDLTVSALTTLQATDITGLLTQTGNRNQTGNYSLLGEFNGPEILIEDNFITTTTGNTDLELRSASSPITFNDNLQIPNNLTINGTSTLENTNIDGLLTLNGTWNQTGTSNITGNVDIDDFRISGSTIETTTSSADLELLANGSGLVKFGINDVDFDQDLTVNGTTTIGLFPTFSYVDVNGLLTHVGNTTQTGNKQVTGNVTVTQDLDVSSQAQFEEVLVAGNVIATTTTNSDLELRANGTGDVISQNQITVSNDVSVASITTGDINVTQDINLDDIVVNSNNIQINDNYIETTISNSDLELRATGKINIQENITLGQNLTVTGVTDLQDTNITGLLTRIGNTNQTGNAVINGNVTVSSDLEINAKVAFEEIVIDDNIITTTSSNADLELRSAGTGSIIVPNNNVDISNNLITNTLNSKGININNTFALENMVSSTDIDIFDNVITTTNSNSNLELRASGAGLVYLQELGFNNNIIASVSSIKLQAPNVIINSTGSLQIPVGNESEILLASAGSIDGGTASITGAIISGGNASTVFTVNDVVYNSAGAASGGSNLGNPGTFRYNTTDNVYEGFDASVISFGQVASDDRNTKVSIHPTTNIITFTANTASAGTIDSTGLHVDEIQVDDINIQSNTISTNNTNADLDLVANGTGNVRLENIDIDFGVLDIDVIGGTGTHTVIFPGNRAVKFPSGTTAERPASPLLGQTRHNSTLNELETWIGTKWQNSAGEFDAISAQEMEDEALVQTLIYG
jgi:cytoskeletal protein CcmA (bactofilin family)